MNDLLIAQILHPIGYLQTEVHQLLSCFVLYRVEERNAQKDELVTFEDMQAVKIQ